MPPLTDDLTAPSRADSGSTYRPELDGLRAVAVLLVVGFHTFPGLLAGGYTGVDVFFVLSGYLITSLLCRNESCELRSFLSFWAGRIRRLFPALTIVLCTTLAVGWLILFPDEYALLGDFVTDSALFIPNLTLLRGSSYFAPTATTKPLLHLWSLGVEEQFYICWPLIVLLNLRNFHRVKLWCLLLLCTSLAYCSAIARTQPVELFYSPFTRCSEILVGAALALYSASARERFSANGAAIIGSILLMLSSFSTVILPAILPSIRVPLSTCGAALMIWAGPRAWINSAVLSRSPAVALGKISYPLYLWHWVLLSYGAILADDTPSIAQRCLIIAASLLLAWATYKWIETPLRFGRYKGLAPKILMVAMALCGISGLLVSQHQGFPERRIERDRRLLDVFENSPPRFQYLHRSDIFRKWRAECAFFNFAPDLAGQPVQNRTHSKPIASIAESCFRRDSRYEHSVLLWGDSHAKALSPGLQKYLPKDWQLLQITTVECVLSIDQQTPSDTSQCNQHNYFAVKTIRETKPDVVVVAQNEDHSALELQRIANYVKTLGVKKVIIVGPVPHWSGELPRILARSRLAPPRRMREHLSLKHVDLNQALQQSLRNDHTQQYADIMKLLCDERGCLTHLGDDIAETLTTWDYGHLTPPTSEFVAQRLLVDLITAPQKSEHP